MPSLFHRLAVSLLAFCLPCALAAEGVETAAGSFTASLRYRYDLFDRSEAAFPHTSIASTARVALGFATRQWQGFSAFAEMQGVYAIGPADYTIATIPGFAKAGYPQINDPSNVTVLNQGYVRWRFDHEPVKLKVTAGRQEVLLNDGRFFSNSLWRQFHQSFDGIQLAAELPLRLTASYGFFNRAHRIVGPDAIDGAPHMATQLITAGWSSKDRAAVSAYAVLLDNHLPLSVWNAPSTSTAGFRVTGPFVINREWRVLYTAEYAKQRDYGNNPLHENANYVLAELGPGWRGFEVKYGTAVLGGRSTTDKISTPMSPPMNGWTELFSVNPSLGASHGLEARYVTVTHAAQNGWNLSAILYDYHSAFHRIHYGREADARVAYRWKQLGDRMETGWRLGYYVADKLYGTGLRMLVFTSFHL